MTRTTQDLDDILDELAALGEEALSPEELTLLLATTLQPDRAEHLLQGLLERAQADAAPSPAEAEGAALTAAAVAALLDAGTLPPPAAANDAEGDARAALAPLRLASPAARLDPARADLLWQRVADQLRPAAAVLPSRRRAAQVVAWAAAAAALLLSLGLWLSRPDPALNGPVAQRDLLQAEARAERVEAEALQRLMRAPEAPAGEHPGDHALRELRQARYDLLVARHQARDRRR